MFMRKRWAVLNETYVSTIASTPEEGLEAGCCTVKERTSIVYRGFHTLTIPFIRAEGVDVLNLGPILVS